MLFAAIFLKDTTLFCQQQQKQKVEDKTNVSITWKELKPFLCQSLGEPKVFVNIILSTIWKDSQYQLEGVMDWVAYLKHL